MYLAMEFMDHGYIKTRYLCQIPLSDTFVRYLCQNFIRYLYVSSHGVDGQQVQMTRHLYQIPLYHTFWYLKKVSDKGILDGLGFWICFSKNVNV